ncbi:MAG: hypothetical protein ABIG71_03600, partial [Candidatus Uhrbacteria bacterium]
MQRIFGLLERVRIQGRMWHLFALTGALVVVFVALTAPHLAFAIDAATVGGIIAFGTQILTYFVGKLLLMAIYALTIIAQYNGFLNSSVVATGWVVVRDVANMFFIVLLLLIAFATILNLSSYKYQQMLPQLIISAVLINFSRTIAGIFIDISQVIMLTFVYGFAAAAGGNFTSMFGISSLMSISPDGGPVAVMQVVGAYLLALFMVSIALVVVLVMIAILAFRIVMLWALVVLSPIPYLLRIFPKRGQRYGQMWWDEFFNYLMVGPVLAFFLWLSLAS